jgi:hypothetical protein
MVMKISGEELDGQYKEDPFFVKCFWVYNYTLFDLWQLRSGSDS